MKPESWRQLVGWSQVICAILGIGLMAWTALASPPQVPRPVIYAAGGTIYMAVVLAAGIGLLRRAHWGLLLSAFVQVPQVLWIATPSLLAKFACGLLVAVQVTPDTATFRMGFEVAAWLGANPSPAQTFVLVNLFPVIALRGLWRLSRPVRGPGSPTTGLVAATEAVPPGAPAA
jgi:hypothetical protein